jgi:hypothetical protein
MGPLLEAAECVKCKLLVQFEARDMVEVVLFLGMTAVWRRKDKLLWLWLHQGLRAGDAVERFLVAAARSVQAPMTREMQLRRGDAAGERTMETYAELVGSLMYLMSCTRPDLAQAVGACRVSCPILEGSIGMQHRRCCSMV